MHNESSYMRIGACCALRLTYYLGARWKKMNRLRSAQGTLIEQLALSFILFSKLENKILSSSELVMLL